MFGSIGRIFKPLMQAATDKDVADNSQLEAPDLAQDGINSADDGAQIEETLAINNSSSSLPTIPSIDDTVPSIGDKIQGLKTKINTEPDNFKNAKKRIDDIETKIDAKPDSLKKAEKRMDEIETEMDGKTSSDTNIEASKDIAFAEDLKASFEDIPLNESSQAAIDEVGVQNMLNADQIAEFSLVGSDVDIASHEEARHALGIYGEKDSISIEEARATLEQARIELNESGVESDLKELVNHPDVDTMLDNLENNGIDFLDVDNSNNKEMLAQDKVLDILGAARDLSNMYGIELPQAEQNTPDVIHDASSTSYDYESANDDYGIV